MFAVEVNNLSFSYGPKTILSNLSVRVDTGDFFGIIGPNGAGKTTLLKLIAGLLKVTQGDVKIFNESINAIKMDKRARQSD